MSNEIIAKMIELGRDELVRTARAVPDDKLEWKPLDNGRTVLDLIAEAAQTPVLVTRLLESNGEEQPSYEKYQALQFEAADWTRDECLEKLRSNTDAVIAAIRAAPAEKLEEPLHLEIGGGMTLPLGVWILMTYRTFMSRTAQINYIQTLYGDFETH